MPINPIFPKTKDLGSKDIGASEERRQRQRPTGNKAKKSRRDHEPHTVVT